METKEEPKPSCSLFIVLRTGPAPGWHLEYIEVKDEAMDQTFRFPCDRWFAKNEDDRQIIRELACANNDAIDLSDKTSSYKWMFAKFQLCNQQRLMTCHMGRDHSAALSVSVFPQNTKSPQRLQTQTTPPPQKTPGSCWREGKLVPKSLSWRIRKRSFYGVSSKGRPGCLSLS